MRPNRHPKATTAADPKERRRDVGLKGIRKGKKPRTDPRDTIEAEVSDPMAIVRRRINQVMTNLGFNLGRQTLLGRGTRRDERPQGRIRHRNA